MLVGIVTQINNILTKPFLLYIVRILTTEGSKEESEEEESEEEESESEEESEDEDEDD